MINLKLNDELSKKTLVVEEEEEVRLHQLQLPTVSLSRLLENWSQPG